MRVQVLLADAAQTDQAGKIHALGLGWNLRSQSPSPMAVVVLINLTSEERGGTHTLRATLVDAGGQPVMTPSPLGDQPVAFTGEFTATTPHPQAPDDADYVVPIAVNIGAGIPFTAGTFYEWRVVIDDKDEDATVCRFHVVERVSP